MGVVHAAWVPAEGGDPGGELLFWAEGPEGAPRAAGGALHPFALGQGPLRELLVALGVKGQLQAGAASLLLPSDEGGPLPDGAATRGASLRPWRVAGARAPLAFAAEWLIGAAGAGAPGRASRPGGEQGGLAVTGAPAPGGPRPPAAAATAPRAAAARGADGVGRPRGPPGRARRRPRCRGGTTCGTGGWRPGWRPSCWPASGSCPGSAAGPTASSRRSGGPS
jgi:hypothetical protein